MRTPRIAAARRAIAMDHLVDATLERYLDWRDQASNTAAAYRSWSAAPTDERRLRFGVYLSALDQEQCAATTYAGSVHELAARLYGSSPQHSQGGTQ
jgi:hypothetical protein